MLFELVDCFQPEKRSRTTEYLYSNSNVHVLPTCCLTSLPLLMLSYLAGESEVVCGLNDLRTWFQQQSPVPKFSRCYWSARTRRCQSSSSIKAEDAQKPRDRRSPVHGQHGAYYCNLLAQHGSIHSHCYCKLSRLSACTAQAKHGNGDVNGS